MCKLDVAMICCYLARLTHGCNGQLCSPGFFAADGPAGRDCKVRRDVMVAVVVAAGDHDDQLGMLPGGRDVTAVRRA
jgi:hypothetical protein